MKKTKIKLLGLMMLTIGSCFSQIDTIFWENGNYTLTSDLENVWIYQKKGTAIKRVKIHTIDIEAGKVEYYFEGVYHDAFINNITMITPAKDYNQELIFRGFYSPIIKLSEVEDGIFYERGNFKFYKKKKQEVIVTKPVVVSTPTFQPEIKKKEDNIISDQKILTNEPNCQLIFGNGKKLEVKLLSINSETMSYKRLDLLSGPLYVIGLSIPGTLRKAKVTTLNGYTIIDYSK